MFSKSELESLEMLSDKVLDNMDCKPNYNNMAFLNIIVLFQSAMMDKMWDLMEEERMEQDDREKMSEKAGQKLLFRIGIAFWNTIIFCSRDSEYLFRIDWRRINY